MVSAISGGFLRVLVWWTGLTFPLCHPVTSKLATYFNHEGGKELMVDDLY